MEGQGRPNLHTDTEADTGARQAQAVADVAEAERAHGEGPRHGLLAGEAIAGERMDVAAEDAVAAAVSAAAAAAGRPADLEEAGQSARRGPRPLFNRASTVLAERWLSGLRASSSAQDSDAAVCAVRSTLSGLPSCLADALAWSLVTRLVRLHNRGGEAQRERAQSARPRVDDLPMLLVDVLGDSATTVDFSPLVRLDNKSSVDHLSFCRRLCGALPRLGQLTRLTLSTHGQRTAYPACSDAVLVEVARCCPELRFLDVGFNRGVSATGLNALCGGCPLIEELLVNDCVLPASVLVALLQRLPRLRVLGHQEVGTAVRLLWTGYRWLRQGHDDDDDDGDVGEDGLGGGYGYSQTPTLRLVQVSNLGEASVHRSRPADEPHRLRCSVALIRVLRVLCPDLEELRVRVLDADVPHLAALRGLHTLELRYHAAARPSSLAAHTVKYLSLHGARLTALTVYSGSLSTRHAALIGQHCPNLTLLWLRCNQLVFSEEGGEEPSGRPAGQPFQRLESLSVRVGFDQTSVSRFPDAFLCGLVRHARALQKLYVAVNSPDVTDAWLARVLDACACESLRTLFVLLPQTNEAPTSPMGPRLALSPASVRAVRARCPQLLELGNLLVWNFQQEEVRHLQQRLRASNCVLRLVSKATVWR